MSDSLDPDQDQHSVDPDLRPKCLQMLSEDKSPLARKELNKNQDLWLIFSTHGLIIYISVISTQIEHS